MRSTSSSWEPSPVYVCKTLATPSGLVGEGSLGEAAELREDLIGGFSKMAGGQRAWRRELASRRHGAASLAAQEGTECQGLEKFPYPLVRGCGGLLVVTGPSELRQSGLCEGPHDQSHRSKSTDSWWSHHDALIDSPHNSRHVFRNQIRPVPSRQKLQRIRRTQRCKITLCHNATSLLCAQTLYGVEPGRRAVPVTAVR